MTMSTVFQSTSILRLQKVSASTLRSGLRSLVVVVIVVVLVVVVWALWWWWWW